MLLMVTIIDEERFKDQWHLDFGYSSHMTDRNDCFVNIKSSMKNMVKFENGNALIAEGISYILIMRKDREKKGQ